MIRVLRKKPHRCACTYMHEKPDNWGRGKIGDVIMSLTPDNGVERQGVALEKDILEDYYN